MFAGRDFGRRDHRCADRRQTRRRLHDHRRRRGPADQLAKRRRVRRFLQLRQGKILRVVFSRVC